MPSNIQIITFLFLSQSLSPNIFLGSDKELSTAMSTPRPCSASKPASSPVLSECSSAHSVDVTDSKVMPDLPVVIEMFAGNAHVLLSELTSDQDVRRERSHEQDSQGPPTVHAQTIAKMKPEKALTAQIEQASEEPAFLSGSEEKLRLANSSTPPADQSLSSLSVFSLEMEGEATPGLPHFCESQRTNEVEMVDGTPPQSTTTESRLTPTTQSEKSRGPACDAVKEGIKEVKKGQEEIKTLLNEEQKDEKGEVMEKEDESSESQPHSGLRPCTTQILSGPVAEDEEVGAGVEQAAGERTGEDGASAPLPVNCPAQPPATLPLPSCFVHLDRLSPRLTRKQRTLFVCLDCAKVFRCFKSLCKHRRFHSGETPFHCPQCPRKFILRKSMRRHMRRHTGEKPYRCPQCSKAFRLRKGLEKHMRARHTAS